jgi:ATP-dependent RNA helicase DeaD
MPEPILKVVRKHIGDAEIIVDSEKKKKKPLVDQYCMIVKREDKLEALRRIIDSAAEFYGLIFCATKIETDELARRLVEAGYPAEAIHGDLSQEIRERTLRRFRLHRPTAANSAAKGGEPAILAATDVAARGLDIENLSHVINWDLPNDRETYIHRIGRTGRAGRRGTAISLATLADRNRIHQISRMMEKNLGTGILWLNVPSVKTVMKALRRRISSAAIAALPEQGTLPEQELVTVSDSAEQLPAAEPAASDKNAGVQPPKRPIEALDEGGRSQDGTASPFLTKVCRNLIERLGAEKAVEALVLLNYGDLLDPDRYGPITEFSEEDFNAPPKGAPFKGRDERRTGASRHGHGRLIPGGVQHSPAGKRGHVRSGSLDREQYRGSGTGEDFIRVYVGQGRQHGLGARDIAALLMRAGGIPGRLVDEIEMKDYCSFATLPADAARRACSFSRQAPQEPVIRAARPMHNEEKR